MYGKHHSKEHNKKVSEALKGKPKSPEHVQNLKKAWITRKAKKNALFLPVPIDN